MAELARESKDVTLLDRSVADALRSWAAPLGCPVAFLESPRTRSLTRVEPDDRCIRTFVRGDVALVSLPSPDASESERDLEPMDVDDLLAMTQDDAPLGAIVDLRATRLRVTDEPPSVELLDEQTFIRRRGAIAMVVINPQIAVLDMLRNAVSPEHWRAGGGDLPATRRVGALAGGVLVALASVDQAEGRLARVRIIVAPGFRHLGFGRTALVELLTMVLRDGALPYCRVAVGDLAASALARAVGFSAFARTLTMQFLTVGDMVLDDHSPSQPA
jgi:GNAT superfamily N-acetyltransferase